MAQPAVRYNHTDKNYLPRRRVRDVIKSQWPLHVMLLPAVAIIAIFSYGPMFGILMAFQNYNPFLGIVDLPWVGLENFRFFSA